MLGRRSVPLLALALAMAGMVGACGASSVDGSGGGTAEQESSGDTSTGAEPVFVSIIDHQQWQTLEAVADPLADHRPDTVDCGIAGFYVENEQLEVDTNYCNYLALAQPSLVAIELGQELQLGLYHFDLTAPEPALAHVAILVEGEVLWERSVEIPDDAQFYVEQFQSPLSAEAGAQVVFHLHNHGQNTWALQELSAAQ